MTTKQLRRNDKDTTVEVRIRLPKELKETLAELANQNNTSFNQVVLLLVNRLLNRKPDIFDILRSSFSAPVLLQSIRRLNTAFSHLRLESPSNTDDFLEKSNRFVDEAKELIKQIAVKENKSA